MDYLCSVDAVIVVEWRLAAKSVSTHSMHVSILSSCALDSRSLYIIMPHSIPSFQIMHKPVNIGSKLLLTDKRDKTTWKYLAEKWMIINNLISWILNVVRIVSHMGNLLRGSFFPFQISEGKTVMYPFWSSNLKYIYFGIASVSSI